MTSNPFVSEPVPGANATPPSRWIDATVTGTNPLMVRLDGFQEEPQPPTKPSLVGGLSVNDRVLCLMQGRQLVVVGRYGG